MSEKQTFSVGTDLPDENIEPEVLREMTIPRMVIPKFEGVVKEEDLAGFEGRDRKMLFAISRLEQKIDFSIRWSQLGNFYQRQIQAQLIRDKNALKEREGIEKENKLRLKIIQWVGITFGAGAVAAFGRRLIEKLWP